MIIVRTHRGTNYRDFEGGRRSSAVGKSQGEPADHGTGGKESNSWTYFKSTIFFD